MNGEKAGYIYIMMNASFPKDLLKIGYTKRDPEIRADELSQNTGLPCEYIVAYDKLVCDCELAERLVHERLKDRRPTTFRNDRSREFFKIKLKEAVKIIDLISDEVGIVEEKPKQHKSPCRGAEITLEGYLKSTGQTGVYQKRVIPQKPEPPKKYKNLEDRFKNFGTQKYRVFGNQIKPVEKTKLSEKRRPLLLRGAHNLKRLSNPEIEKDSNRVIKIIEESVNDFKAALEITDMETPNYELYNLIGIAYSYVVVKRHKFKTKLDMPTLIYYQELSIKCHLRSIEENPKSVDGYEHLAHSYSMYNDWSKKEKAIEMLNKAKELNPTKADEYDRRIKAIEKEKRKWWQIF